MDLPRFAAPRAALVMLSLLLVGALAACGGDGAASAPETADPGRTGTVTGGSITITADDLEFNLDVIEAPAGETFTVVFENLEAVPHNWSLRVEEGGEEIVVGEVITGPDASVEVEVPALDAGEYFFVCDIHPADMTGTLVVGG